MTNRVRYTLWFLQSMLMVPAGILFLVTPLSVGADNESDWIATGMVVSFGVIVLYVEGWLWWHRLRRQRS